MFSIKKARETTPPVLGVTVYPDDILTFRFSTDIVGKDMLLDREGEIERATLAFQKALKAQLDVMTFKSITRGKDD